MTDRELLEMAAKAAGYDYECTAHTGYPENDQHQIRSPSGMLVDWNPLTDDGDALRLAVKLRLFIRFTKDRLWVHSGIPMGRGQNEYAACSIEDGDAFGATREAIVEMAAAIGRKMP